MGAEVVRAVTLTRVFGTRTAVDGLTLSAHAGETLALLGPNGAGKTTTFRMLAGLLLPTAGEIAIAGTILTPDTADLVRTRVGLLTEAPGLWERLTVRANLETYARLFGLADPARRVGEVMDAVQISERAEDRAGSLSKGLKQRVAIARALVHNPPVVLLDEPTAGLDPSSARQVRDLIHGLAADGRAVLVSTHNLPEAEELADRIAVMNGRLLALDTPRALRERRGAGLVRLEFEGGASGWADTLRATGATPHQPDGDALLVSLGRGQSIPDLVSSLVAAGGRLRGVVPQDASLEEAYLELVEPDAGRPNG